jgi:hypothetical protein
MEKMEEGFFGIWRQIQYGIHVYAHAALISHKEEDMHKKVVSTITTSQTTQKLGKEEQK